MTTWRRGFFAYLHLGLFVLAAISYYILGTHFFSREIAAF